MFCSISAWHKHCGGDRVRYRQPEAVAEEMASLYRRGVRIFNFHDDNFVMEPKDAMLDRIERLGSALADRGVGRIAFACKARPGTVDEEVFGGLRRLGLFRVFLGIEAGTDVSLRQLGRRQTVEENVRALRIIEGMGVHLAFNLLMLNPRSSLEDLAGNIAFLRANPMHPMNFCRTEIYAGTPLERMLRRDGKLLGNMWGFGYVIADPRAQAAFDVIRRAFWDRCYGTECLHHRCMQVDFEHQMLEHFHGHHASLRRRVKDFVVRVNNDTAAHLEEVVEALRDGAATEPAFAEDLKLRIAASGARLDIDGIALVREIRKSAAPPRASRTVSRTVAAAGLAATIVLPLAACDTDTHATEMVAVPSEPHRGGVEDPEPIPTETAAEVVKAAVGAVLLPKLEEVAGPDAPTEVAIRIGEDGKVESVGLGPPFTGALEQTLQAELEALEVSDSRTFGQSYLLRFGPEGAGIPEVPDEPVDEPVDEPEYPTYPTEMAPRPYVTEMAPAPHFAEMVPDPGPHLSEEAPEPTHIYEMIPTPAPEPEAEE